MSGTDSKTAALVNVVAKAVEPRFASIEASVLAVTQALARIEADLAGVGQAVQALHTNIARINLDSAGAVPAQERKTGGRGGGRSASAKKPAAAGVPNNALIYFKRLVATDAEDARNAYITSEQIERLGREPALVKLVATKDDKPSSSWWSSLAGSVWKEMSKERQDELRQKLAKLKESSTAPATVSGALDEYEGADPDMN